MYVFLFMCLPIVCGSRSHDTHFLLTAISDSACTSAIYLTMTSLEEDNADVTISFPRKPNDYCIKTVAQYGHWTDVTLPPHVKLKDYGKRDNGRFRAVLTNGHAGHLPWGRTSTV